MTVLYARSDVMSVTTSKGRELHRPVTKKGTKTEPDQVAAEFPVEVDDEEAEGLIASGLFGGNAASVPLSPDEIEDRERLKEEGGVALRAAAEGIATAARRAADEPATAKTRPRR